MIDTFALVLSHALLVLTIIRVLKTPEPSEPSKKPPPRPAPLKRF